MDFNSESDQQLENVYDEEYKERDYLTRQEAKREREVREYKHWFMRRKMKKADKEGEAGVYSLFRILSSNKKKKVEMFWVKLVFKN